MQCSVDASRLLRQAAADADAAPSSQSSSTSRGVSTSNNAFASLAKGSIEAILHCQSVVAIDDPNSCELLSTGREGEGMPHIGDAFADYAASPSSPISSPVVGYVPLACDLIFTTDIDIGGGGGAAGRAAKACNAQLLRSVAALVALMKRMGPQVPMHGSGGSARRGLHPIWDVAGGSGMPYADTEGDGEDGAERRRMQCGGAGAADDVGALCSCDEEDGERDGVARGGRVASPSPQAPLEDGGEETHGLLCSAGTPTATTGNGKLPPPVRGISPRSIGRVDRPQVKKEEEKGSLSPLSPPRRRCVPLIAGLHSTAEAHAF